ncbi:uncharacterized protein LOC106657033 [Trichogramma pretiosum]|uniref:uncharacterized protein LOC106657033 n=1 Tax=Trichogramma pretiosum TaxID=7493 RepID=UPI0006C96815|nr:uncharacterized protein LOC106657033 [Trichogramma pretiosum]
MNCDIKLFKCSFFIGLTLLFLVQHITATNCSIEVSQIQPSVALSADDNKEYTIIQIPGFIQKATVVKCNPKESCEEGGSCEQNYKLHQFLSLPADKRVFEIDDLKLRFFNLPYQCKSCKKADQQS